MDPYRAASTAAEDQYGGDPIFMDHAKSLLRMAQSSASKAFIDNSLASLAQDLEGRADHEIGEIQSGDPRRVACAKGCSFCCSQSVGATVPEIIAIADYIRDSWSIEEIDAFRMRIAEYRKRFEPFVEGSVETAPRFPCPLLRDGTCSVWQVRPLVCRSYNSFDATRCQQRERNSIANIQIFGLWKQRAVADAIGLGIFRAVREKNLWPDQCDLVLGLDIALAEPNAASLYLAGSVIFEPAASRGAREWRKANPS